MPSKTRFSQFNTASILTVSLLLPLAACGDDDPRSPDSSSECKGPGESTCDVACVDLASDPNNCGVCGNTCNSSDVCSKGICKDKCDDGLTNCLRACVNTYTDSNHCGGCQHACDSEKLCAQGECKATCVTECSDICTDTDIDSLNCGACGNQCDRDQICVKGGCIQICELYDVCNGCAVDGASYPTGAPNPSNPCEICDYTAPTMWTQRSPGSNCGDGMLCSGDNECVGGCFIEGLFYELGDKNPDATCEICTASSQTQWGAEPEGTQCGPGQYCTGDHHCVAGCVIEGSLYAVADKNPGNRCEYCSASSPTKWAAEPVGTQCGAGQYCSADHHCIEACLIGETVYPRDTVNTANHCEICGDSNTTAWSLAEAGSPCSSDGGVACSADGECVAPITVSAGAYFSCVLTSKGAVKCWGLNDISQLGDGTTTHSPTPRQAVGLESGVLAISAGHSHACAVTSAGAALCWGRNDSGQLGDGSYESKNAPTPVYGLATGVQTISAGTNHTCALTITGAVLCWGSNLAGQIGDGTNVTAIVPKHLTMLGYGNKAISVGGSSTCLIDPQNNLLCWGNNSTGQLGIGPGSSQWPKHVASLTTDVVAISTGSNTSCAIVHGGKLLCAGLNSRNEIDSSSNVVYFHQEIAGLGSGMTHVSVRQDFICARSIDGLVRCWGDNDYGQLGNGSVSKNPIPTVVAGLEAPVTSVTTGSSHACAITHTKLLKCWGNNSWGQLGSGPGTPSNTPIQVTGFP